MTGADAVAPGRALVIGVGNRFRGDDGVGAAVLDALGEIEATAAGLDLLELDGEPTRLVDAWHARPSVIVVDAVLTDDVEPGGLVVLEGESALDPDRVGHWSAGVSGHSAGLGEALRLAAVLDRLPAELVVLGVAANDFGDGPGLSGPVQRAVDDVVAEIRRRTVDLGS